MRIYCISKTECASLRLKKKAITEFPYLHQVVRDTPKTNKIDNVTAYKALDVRQKQSKSP